MPPTISSPSKQRTDYPDTAVNCRNYITQNFDLKKSVFLEKGMARFIQLLLETQEAKRKPRTTPLLKWRVN